MSQCQTPSAPSTLTVSLTGYRVIQCNHWCTVDHFIQVEVFRDLRVDPGFGLFSTETGWVSIILFDLLLDKANIIFWQISLRRPEVGLKWYPLISEYDRNQQCAVWDLHRTIPDSHTAFPAAFTDIYLWITMNSNVYPLWLNTSFSA